MQSYEQLEPGIETGIVKFFDGRDNKRFGFIVLESGEEIFFHYNDGMIAAAGESCLVWYTPNRNSRTALDYPKSGERLYFQRAKGSKGPKASPWTSEKYYKEALEDLICPCGHHKTEHSLGGGESCEKCECPRFGEPFENWYTDSLTEVWFTEPPGGHRGYE